MKNKSLLDKWIKYILKFEKHAACPLGHVAPL